MIINYSLFYRNGRECMTWIRLTVSLVLSLALISFERNTQLSFKIMTEIHLHYLQLELA